MSNSGGVTVHHERKSDGVRVHHEKKSDWVRFTMRERTMVFTIHHENCLLYTSPSPRDA